MIQWPSTALTQRRMEEARAQGERMSRPPPNGARERGTEQGTEEGTEQGTVQGPQTGAPHTAPTRLPKRWLLEVLDLDCSTDPHRHAPASLPSRKGEQQFREPASKNTLPSTAACWQLT